MYSQAQMEQLIFLKLHYARLVWLVNLMTIYSEAEEIYVKCKFATLAYITYGDSFVRTAEFILHGAGGKLVLVLHEGNYYLTTQDHYDIKSLTLS